MRDPEEGVSPERTIVTGARRDRVPAGFERVLEVVADQLSSLPEVSLYVYGSVATGQARVGRSDVDLLSIGMPADDAAALATSVGRRCPGMCRAVDIGPADPQHFVGEDPEAYGNRVFLRHYCVHVRGPRMHADLPSFPADARAARGFNGDIARRSRQWRARTERAGRPADDLARRVARKALFALAGLVSVHDATWTTDRLRAADRWAEVEPDLGPPPGRPGDLERRTGPSGGRRAPSGGRRAPSGAGTRRAPRPDLALVRGANRSVVTRTQVHLGTDLLTDRLPVLDPTADTPWPLEAVE